MYVPVLTTKRLYLSLDIYAQHVCNKILQLYTVIHGNTVIVAKANCEACHTLLVSVIK